MRDAAAFVSFSSSDEPLPAIVVMALRDARPGAMAVGMGFKSSGL